VRLRAKKTGGWMPTFDFDFGAAEPPELREDNSNEIQ
jgi:hypothetical protein